MRPLLVVVSLSLSASVAAAQGDSHAIIVKPDQVAWAPAPPSLPAGAQAAVLEGNPKQAGPFTMRISLPDGYRIAPHFHPAVERVTVIQGTFRLGMGDKFDGTALTAYPTGTFIAMQPGTHHYVEAQGTTIVQINGVGPWKLTYVNPADNPAKSTP
jgi:quercetin dioxygenase-like cupin family protein